MESKSMNSKEKLILRKIKRKNVSKTKSKILVKRRRDSSLTVLKNKSDSLLKNSSSESGVTVSDSRRFFVKHKTKKIRSTHKTKTKTKLRKKVAQFHKASDSHESFKSKEKSTSSERRIVKVPSQDKISDFKDRSPSNEKIIKIATKDKLSALERSESLKLKAHGPKERSPRSSSSIWKKKVLKSPLKEKAPEPKEKSPGSVSSKEKVLKSPLKEKAPEPKEKPPGSISSGKKILKSPKLKASGWQEKSPTVQEKSPNKSDGKKVTKSEDEIGSRASSSQGPTPAKPESTASKKKEEVDWNWFLKSNWSYMLMAVVGIVIALNLFR